MIVSAYATRISTSARSKSIIALPSFVEQLMARAH
jgi:hypothetical protein